MTPPSETPGLGERTDIADLTSVMNSVRILFRGVRLNNVDVERKLGISLAQLFVLEQLAEHPGCSVNDLAALTGTHQSSVSVVVRKLTERGLAEKRTASDDARRVELSLTPEGRGLLGRSPLTFQARLLAALHKLGSDRTHMLAETLTDWLRLCGVEDPSPPMFFEEEPKRRVQLERGATNGDGTR
jgi:MarR family transcriptional regulator, lower aerobic nicotinate degradation pathway regulator